MWTVGAFLDAFYDMQKSLLPGPQLEHGEPLWGLYVWIPLLHKNKT